jgi:xanthine/CO dehydrogenase XdhC/CoxF family maturation factor
MSHSLTQDRARLKVLLTQPKLAWRYLGQLGPSYRTERLLTEIAQTLDIPKILQAGIKQLHYPIGYKLGGDGPEALALGIIAQISAEMYQQTPMIDSTVITDILSATV